MASRNFVIDDDTELEKIRLETERASQGDVIRDALELYKYLLNEVRLNERIFIGKSRDTVKDELKMDTLEKARECARKSRIHVVP